MNVLWCRGWWTGYPVSSRKLVYGQFYIVNKFKCIMHTYKCTFGQIFWQVKDYCFLSTRHLWFVRRAGRWYLWVSSSAPFCHTHRVSCTWRTTKGEGQGLLPEHDCHPRPLPSVSMQFQIKVPVSDLFLFLHQFLWFRLKLDSRRFRSAV